MRFSGAGEALRKANESYYRRKGAGIYEDFGTVVKFCPLLAQADAKDFSLHRFGAAGKISIFDFGIGNGAYAFDFLDEVGRLAPAHYARIRYALCDISEKMLANAMASERAAKHRGRLEAIAADASAAPAFAADYVRSNEMYDDLEARIFVLRKGKFYEVLLAPEGKVVNKKYLEVAEAEVPAQMRGVLKECEGHERLWNAGALAHLRASMKALKPGGWIDIYDYGHALPEEALEEPEEVWNEGSVREYGGQLTVDVSFWLLAAEAQRAGFAARVQTVSERLQKSFGRQFRFVDMRSGKKAWVGYMDEAEMRRRKAELLRAGYGQEFIDGEMEEKDEYLHLRVERA